MVAVTGMTAQSFKDQFGADIFTASIAKNNHLYLKSRSGRNIVDAGLVEPLDDFITRLTRIEAEPDEGIWHYIDSETGEPRFRKISSNNPQGNYGDPWQTVRYRKDNGFVTLEGLMKLGEASASMTLFTLPEGFRPKMSIMFPIDANVDTGPASTGTAHTHTLNNTAARLVITSDGVLTTGAPGNFGTISHLSLSGIQFDTRN